MSRKQAVATLENASKRYGAVRALDGLDIDVRTGEVLALLGPNGAGKTTAVHLLLGMLRPDEGRVRVFGLPPGRIRARTRVGAMLQVSNVPETMRVAEHIRLFRSYYPRPLDAQAIVAMAGLQGLERRFFGKLSAGQKQRVMFALAVCGDPQLLFLDEPTVGLDVESRRNFWDGIRRLVQHKRTVVLTTHYLDEADALADRIVVINHGRKIAEGTPAQIKARSAARRIRCVSRLARERIAAFPGVVSARRNGSYTEILTPDAEAVTRRLLDSDPQLRDLEIGGAGLEDAFLALTREVARGRGDAA